MDHKEFRLQPRSAYIHIPFCHRRCFYCDFAVVPLGDKASGDSGPGSESIKAYLKLLHREISLSLSGPPLSTVYIGGGTPSLLSPHQISSLLEHLAKQFGLQQGAELTLEIDPGSINQQKLDAFIEVGINRISLGGQSFNDGVLKQLGRSHTSQDFLEACSWLRQAYSLGKLRSWSLDLIQNLPNQSLEDWREQLDLAIESSAPHLSIYELSIEPGTVFDWRKKRGELHLPKEDLAVEMISQTSAFLQTVGFARYEISNYALPGHASRHNRVYWSGSGWWGFGQGATSAPWGQRFSRPRIRSDYQSWIDNQLLEGLHASLLVHSSLKLSFEDQVIVGLRRREGVDLEMVAKNFGWQQKQCMEYLPSLINRWSVYIEKGSLKFLGKRVLLTDPEGMLITNQILVELLLWWDSLPDAVVSLPKSLELRRKVDGQKSKQG